MTHPILRQWRFFFSIESSYKVRVALENHALFGQDETRGWHRSRGRLRSIRLDPRWGWTHVYEVFPTGFMTDDPDIAAAFQHLVATLETPDYVGDGQATITPAPEASGTASHG